MLLGLGISAIPFTLSLRRYNDRLMAKKAAPKLFKRVKMKSSTRKVKVKMKDRKRGN